MEKVIAEPKEHVRIKGVVRMSSDLDHKEKMNALDKLIKLQKESNRRDLIVLVVSIVVNLGISLIIKFL